MQPAHCNRRGQEPGESIPQPHSPPCVPCPATAPHSLNLTGTQRAREPMDVVHIESVTQGTKNGCEEGKLVSKWSQSV